MIARQKQAAAARRRGAWPGDSRSPRPKMALDGGIERDALPLVSQLDASRGAARQPMA